MKEITLIWKENINIVWKEKKVSSESNRTILIHSTVSDRIILIHSNVSMFFKKQHTNTLYCFANRRSLDESSSSMDDKSFLKKRLFPLTAGDCSRYRGTIKIVGQSQLSTGQIHSIFERFYWKDLLCLD